MANDIEQGVEDAVIADQLITGLELEITDDTARSYTNSVGDERFDAFQAQVLLTNGMRIAPNMIFDRELGTRLVGPTQAFALHAKQEFRFRKPLEIGSTYQMRGRMSEVYSKRDVDYVELVSHCHEIGNSSEWNIESVYTRAVGFSKQVSDRRSNRPSLPLSSWFETVGAEHGVGFPAVGSVVHGPVRVFDQTLVNLYSGPRSSFHTDANEARKSGLSGTEIQGLMATQLETELYRDIFGLRFFEIGDISVSYIAPIPVASALQAYCVVEEHGIAGTRLRSAVVTSSGDVVTVGRASCGIVN